MSTGYLAIRNDYLAKAWARGPEVLAACLPAEPDHRHLKFRAFGEDCLLMKDDIFLACRSAQGPEGLLIALYASVAPALEAPLLPLKAFKELSGSMPYQGAFAVNVEKVLAPHTENIYKNRERLIRLFSGRHNEDAVSGDFSFTLFPLPKIPLYYVFHLPDEEFPAAVTCLFGGNAAGFLPLDALADIAEYTARKIIDLLV
jgi:hypothetical protein